MSDSLSLSHFFFGGGGCVDLERTGDEGAETGSVVLCEEVWSGTEVC